MTKKSELEIKQWLELFQEISDFHWRLNVLPIWEKYEKGKKPWQSVALFLSNYAFETAGVNPNYAPVAAYVVEHCKDKFDAGINTNTKLEEDIWDAFSKEMKGGGLKKFGNPLFPFSKDGKSTSLIHQMQENEITNLVPTMRKYLKENKMTVASDFLKSIRGVGPKLSAFFLRDVKEYFDIELPKDNTRNCLQPIDIWIKRIVVGDYNPGKKMSDKEVASFIVKYSRNPERVNMGMWYFGSVVCGRGWYRFEKTFQDFATAKKVWEEYYKKIQGICRCR